MAEITQNVSVEAKIEEALAKVAKAKKTGQFGMWAEQLFGMRNLGSNNAIDNFIITTIKNFPEANLSFVDELTRTHVSNYSKRQQSKKREPTRGGETYWHLHKNMLFNYPILNKVKIYGQEIIELKNDQQNIIVPESLKWRLVPDKEHKYKMNVTNITKKEKEILIDAILHDHLSKLSDEYYAMLFNQLENSTLNTESKLQQVNKKSLSNLNILFHELNHAVCKKEYLHFSSPQEQNLIFLTASQNKNLKPQFSVENNQSFVEFAGGLAFVHYANYGDKINCEQNLATAYLHEGITEALTLQQISVLYPHLKSQFDYNSTISIYGPFVLVATALNLIHDNVLTKAYYNGNEEFSKMENRKDVEQVLIDMKGICEVYGELDNKDRTKTDEELLQALRVSALNTVRTLCLQAIKKHTPKKGQTEDWYEEFKNVIKCMQDKKVWLGVFPKLDQNTQQREDEFLKLIEDVVRYENNIANYMYHKGVMNEYLDQRMKKVYNQEDMPAKNLVEMKDKKDFEKLKIMKDIHTERIKQNKVKKTFMSRIKLATAQDYAERKRKKREEIETLLNLPEEEYKTIDNTPTLSIRPKP